MNSHRWRLISRLIDCMWDYTDLSDTANQVAWLIHEELACGATVMLLDELDPDNAICAFAVPPERRAAAEPMLRSFSIPDIQALIGALDTRAWYGLAELEEHLSGQAVSRRLAEYARMAELVEAVACPIPGRHNAPCGLILGTRGPEGTPFNADDRFALVGAADSVGMGLAMGLATDEARRATARWERAFNLSPFGYAVSDTESRFSEINPAGAQILGRTPAEVLGLRTREVFDVTDDEYDPAPLAALVNDDVPYLLDERRVRRRDGSTRWIYRSLTMGRDAKGVPTEAHMIFMDVTDEREAETRAELYANLVESAPDFIGVAELTGQLRYLNRAGRALVHLPDEVDITTTRITDFNPTDMASAYERWTDTGTFQGDGELRDWADGSLIPVSERAFVVNDPHTGEPMAIGSIQRDIRERLGSEKAIADLAEQRRVLLTELLAAEQAERARIAGDVHDDALQLLAAGQLRLQLLLGQLDRGDVAAARSAADHVADMLSDAQAQLRRLLLDLESPTEPGRGLEEALRETAQSFFADTPTVVTITGTLSELPSDVAAVFYRAGREAVSNARQHAHADHLTVRLAEDAGSWWMTVGDDGVGVPEPIPYRPGHLGVRGMSNRVAALGGSFTIRRAAAGGTEVVLRVPRSASAGSGDLVQH